MSVFFKGRTRVRYNYARWGWTRGGGKTWHGGIDLEGLDDTTIVMPGYKDKSITGVVTRARIATDRSNPTWEWGYYVTVKLDAGQTPDAVNYLYFCHCKQLLCKVGQRVKTGDKLAIMGATGNATLASPPYAHCHFEVRAGCNGGKGLDPTDYAGVPNAVGVYGAVSTVDTASNADAETVTAGKLQRCTCGPMSGGDAVQFMALAQRLGITYKSEYVEA